MEREPDSGLEKAIDSAKDAAGELRKTLDGISKGKDAWFGGGYNKEAMDFIENYRGSSDAVNEMKRALEEARSAVKSLEGQGKWFGDEEYDAAIAKLDRINSDIKQYKKEISSPPPAANPFGLDTIAGKIREAELALQSLETAGKGLGSADYDEACLLYTSSETCFFAG